LLKGIEQDGKVSLNLKKERNFKKGRSIFRWYEYQLVVLFDGERQFIKIM
jgi:hypothetical protein